MDINAKIKLSAETMSGYSVIVDSSNGANVELSKTAMPCILVFIQDTGEFLSSNSHYRDSVNIKVAVLNKIPKGFKESDVESMRYDLKQDMILLYHKLRFDFQFKINNESVKYEIVYDEFDDNLIGLVFNDNIKERVGLNLACETPDSIVELPTSMSFCQKVSECSSIVSINELLDSLQEQIDNLPTGGVESVSGGLVDNTDPLNPLINTPSVQDTITENPKVNGVIFESADGLTKVNILDGALSLSSEDTGGNTSNFDITPTAIGSRVGDVLNSSFHTVSADQIENTTELLTYNGYEVATINFVDNRVQSNIKIIGDWDATSGSYPLADESNTTPFISQWGATIKAGWAFRVGYGQAGNVGGYEYENGDVVYALIDSPTDSPSDWGDLDHNLQQADEALRGTAKIVEAATIADETSIDDERIVTTKKLWLNFWTRVLAIAHTFAAKITFTTAPRFDSATNNSYLKTGPFKDLTSVSAIPAADITEDSTHRFSTDAEKTIWNKAPIFSFVSGSDFTTTSLTLVDITGLSSALQANSTYEFTAKLTVESSSNAGLNTGVNFSAAGATIEAGEYGSRDGEVGKVARITAFNTSGSVTSFIRLSATPQTHEIKGIIRTGANAGNLTIKVLKTSSGTAKVYIDSYLKTTKI